MPTSMTVAPGLTKAGVTKPARPIATTRMSAVAATAGRSAVREWQMVTVALACSSIKRHRLADDVAAADDDGVAAGHRDVGAAQHLHDAGRRARAQRGPVLHQPADVHRAEPVDVLGRVDGLEDGQLGMRRRAPPAAATGPGCRRAPGWRSAAAPRPARRRATRSPAAGSGRRSARIRHRSSPCCGRRPRRPDRRRPARYPSAGGRPSACCTRPHAICQVVADRLADHHAVEHAAAGHLDIAHVRGNYSVGTLQGPAAARVSRLDAPHQPSLECRPFDVRAARLVPLRREPQ